MRRISEQDQRAVVPVGAVDARHLVHQEVVDAVNTAT
jgi:hypothetical protein